MHAIICPVGGCQPFPRQSGRTKSNMACRRPLPERLHRRRQDQRARPRGRGAGQESAVLGMTPRCADRGGAAGRGGRSGWHRSRLSSVTASAHVRALPSVNAWTPARRCACLHATPTSASGPPDRAPVQAPTRSRGSCTPLHLNRFVLHVPTCVRSCQRTRPE